MEYYDFNTFISHLNNLNIHLGKLVMYKGCYVARDNKNILTFYPQTNNDYLIYWGEALAFSNAGYTIELPK